MVVVSLRKGRHGGSRKRPNQGGTAKRKLSPLNGVRAFLYAKSAKKGGGHLESDLVELDCQRPKLFSVKSITGGCLPDRCTEIKGELQ